MNGQEMELGKIETLPLLPLKNSVVLPYVAMPLGFGRPLSVAAAEAAAASEGKEVVVVTQRNASMEAPAPGDFYGFGTKAVIRKIMRGEGGINLIVQGLERAEIIGFEQTEPYYKARVFLAPLPEDHSPELVALHRALLDLSAKALALVQPQIQVDLSQLLPSGVDPLMHVYLLGSMISMEPEKEQA